ncbi:MAG: pseudomurein-binding protein [Methanobacteriales archaeon HGW-Methanobacteriales-1]|jgi:transglutaminase-like putative cysteine protease|nr:MAG: pseudomurein-binding protein [Methanobacteriales archaeon HGW-Methanobacteriales-1]
MKAKIEKNLKKIDLKDYSFLRRLEILNNISKSTLIVFFMAIFILSAASIETVQADEGIVNSSTNNTNITNITNSSDEPDSSLSKSEILNSSTQVANYIEKNKKLPDTVNTEVKVISISQYLYAVSSFITGSNNVTLFNVSGRTYSVSRFSTSYTLSQYRALALKTSNYMYTYHKILPYISSTHGNLDYYNMIYMFSKIARYYKIYGKMPKSVYLVSQIPKTARKFSSSYVDKTISSLYSRLKSTKISKGKLAATIKKTKNTTTLKKLQIQYNSLQSKYKYISSKLKYYKSLKNSRWYIPSTMRKYLKETKYCQITNANIVYVATNLKGSTPYETGTKIFNWVRDHVDYSFYYRTKYGAANTLKKRLGNCADQAHLIVALARTSGLPARYVRGTCKFVVSGNVYTHVWAQIWIKGRGWVTADSSSYLNSFGVIRSWNPKKSKITEKLIQYSL